MNTLTAKQGSIVTIASSTTTGDQALLNGIATRLDKILIVIQGIGYYQEKRQTGPHHTRRRCGEDLANTEHWHGASHTNAMIH